MRRSPQGVYRFGFSRSPISATVEKTEISPKATVRLETPPGGHRLIGRKSDIFFDESGVRRKIYAFVMVLSYSRMLFVEFVTDISTETLIECHQKAFARFGGYTRKILYDNMKQVRLSQPEWNPLFQDFLAHYGIAANTHIRSERALKARLSVPFYICSIILSKAESLKIWRT